MLVPKAKSWCLRLVKVAMAVFILSLTFPASTFSQKIEVIYWGHASHIKALSGVIPEFEKENPNIKIIAVPTAETEKKLLASVMAGKGAPDVGFINANLLGAFSRKEGAGLIDLSKAPYNGMELSKDFVPYIFSQLITPGKKLIGLPLDIGTLGSFYRKDAFDAIGVDPARFKNWDEFIDAARKLRANGQYIAENASDFFYVIRGSDNTGVFDDKGRLQTGSPAFIKALRLALAIRAADSDAQIAPWSAEAQVAMKEGKVVNYIQASWYGLMMNIWAPATKGKWRVAPLPGSDAINQNDMGVDVLPEQSKHKAEAWKFMKFVTASAKGAVLGMKAGGFFWVPSYKPAWPDVAKLTDPMFGGQNTMAVIIETTKRLSPNPFVITDKDEMVMNLLMEKVREALQDPTVDPKTFLEKATDEIANTL